MGTIQHPYTEELKILTLNTKTVLEGTGSNESETELKAVSHRTKIKKLDERKNVGESSMVVPDRIRLNNYRMCVCYCSFHGDYKV